MISRRASTAPGQTLDTRAKCCVFDLRWLAMEIDRVRIGVLAVIEAIEALRHLDHVAFAELDPL